VNKRTVGACKACSLCLLYLPRNHILNMCPREATWLWCQKWCETKVIGKYVELVK